MAIELTREDVIRLYGRLIYQVPSASEQLALMFSQGKPVVWKMKPEARIALVLSQEEFGQRTLTAKLKEAILAAGIDIQHIGFGMLKGNAPWNFSDMPTEHGIVFSKTNQEVASKLTVKDKHLQLFPPLTQIAEDENIYNQLIKTLEELRIEND